MDPLHLVGLSALMERTSGDAEVLVGLIDGPIAVGHPDLADARIREAPGRAAGMCAHAGSLACMHGTFVAGILSARRGSGAPAICPGCTLLVRPIFEESQSSGGAIPEATPEALAEAITETIDAGAYVINLSAALVQSSAGGERELQAALEYAVRRGVLVVAAAGNQATVGATSITRHPWVIPVAACDDQGRPLGYSNLGSSIGRRGLSAPGDNITSLGANGGPPAFSGTSAAAPFVTGTVALLFSLFPQATALDVKRAVSQPETRRRTVVPPLLDAWAAYQVLAREHGRR